MNVKPFAKAKTDAVILLNIFLDLFPFLIVILPTQSAIEICETYVTYMKN